MRLSIADLFVGNALSGLGHAAIRVPLRPTPHALQNHPAQGGAFARLAPRVI